MTILDRMSPREKKILYVVIGMLVLLVIYHGALIPVEKKFSELNNEIFSMQLKIRKAKTFLRQKDDIYEQADKFSNLEQMDAGTDEEEIARLLNFIEKTARKNGVGLSDVKPQQVQADKWSKRFVVELNSESGVPELIRFVYEIQNSEQMLKVEKVDMAPTQEQSKIMRSFLIVTKVVVK